MGLHTRLTDLPVTGGSHVSHAILLDRSRPMKHFWVRARIELWCGVRDRFSTASATSAVYETGRFCQLCMDYGVSALCTCPHHIRSGFSRELERY